MEVIIREGLESLEAERGFRVLYACESGSRAWGFASPDSDWDVRFIYAYPEEMYLSILDMKDAVNLGVKNGLDYAGWELRKTLRMISKSNASPFEWLQSATVYLDRGGFRDGLWSLAPQFAQSLPMLKHYCGLTRTSLKRVNKTDGSWKLKTLFYVLRAAYATTWVLDRGTIPPMEFEPLREMEPANLEPLVNDLLAQKLAEDEDATIKPVLDIATYATDLLDRCEEAGQGMTMDEVDLEPLHLFFRSSIQ